MPTSPSPPPPPPPPAAFSFTSGDFDFPQATSSPPPPPPPRATSRVEGLARFLGQRQRERERRAVAEALENEATRGPLVARARRRQLLRETRQALPPHAERDPVLSTLDPRWTLLGSQPFNPFAARSPTSDTEAPSRQSKRRKLDHQPGCTSEYDGFKYGYKGQVVAGRLKMTIESCDGGEHDKHNSERLYRAQNVLDNDKSVYCTEDSQCNLLLKHHGEAPFCLERIVIRAPDRGFTAPVQEGLIFVSMSGEELLANTPNYHINYASYSPTASPSPVSSIPVDDQIVSLQEAIEDPQAWERSRRAMEQQVERLRIRHRQRSELNAFERHPRRLRPHLNEYNETNESEDPPDYCPYHLEEDDDDADADADADGPHTAIGVSAPTPPPFTITTSSDHSDSENDTNPNPSPAIMADRLRRESRWRSSSDEDDDNDPSSRFPLLRRARAHDNWENFNERRWRSHRIATAPIDPIRATRLRAPSRIEQKKHTGRIDGVARKPLIKPLAQFFIERHRNKINVNFPVPISGKYVLLKLWSPTADGNIDIESIQCFGYSGPRFFPVVQMR